jgi:hypothetical protein
MCRLRFLDIPRLKRGGLCRLLRSGRLSCRRLWLRRYHRWRCLASGRSRGLWRRRWAVVLPLLGGGVEPVAPAVSGIAPAVASIVVPGAGLQQTRGTTVGVRRGSDAAPQLLFPAFPS